jgi:ubiquinone/menaquinone biosynthesis C-methylase UbiE
MATGHWPAARQILERLDLQPGQWFLDVGCGNGYTVAWAAERVAPQGQAWGIELSENMLSVARKNVTVPNAHFQQANVQALPFEEGVFDNVIAIESLYYWPDIPAALSQIHRVLKPGGWWVAMVDFYQENPYCASWPTLLNLPLTLWGEAEYTKAFTHAGFCHVQTERLLNPTPVDPKTFQPGWGFETVEDVKTFRLAVGSLAIWGQRPPL